MRLLDQRISCTIYSGTQKSTSSDDIMSKDAVNDTRKAGHCLILVCSIRVFREVKIQISEYNYEYLR
jgi:hypothetical protein